MSALNAPQTLREFPLAFLEQSVTLATSGFGVVVALAWNEFIHDLIMNYIQPYFGQNSGLVSKLIYALLVTFLAIMVTMQLVRLQQTAGRVLSRKEKALIKE